MTLEEEFLDIIEHQKTDVLDTFIVKLTEHKCKKLRRILQHYVAKFKAEQINQKISYTDIQLNILQSITKCCFSYKDLKLQADFMTTDDILLHIPIWYKKEFIKKYLDEHLVYIRYPIVLQLIKDGLFEPPPSYIVTSVIYGLDDTIQADIAFKKHIWYIFLYDNNIYNNNIWLDRFQSFIKQKKISRQKVLQESLLVATRGFNKPMTGWFFKLFAYLEPTDDELLSLQYELIQVLDTEHSKPINESLKYIKRIMFHQDFMLSEFIDKVPILVMSSTKSIISTTLIMIDKIMKHTSQYKKQLALALSDVLLIKDEKIQTKAIKILQKHSLLNTAKDYELIEPYKESLFHSVTEMLPLLKKQDIASQELDITIKSNIYKPLEVYSDIDDLIYFYMHFFYDKDNSTTFDDFVRHLLPLHNAINKSTIDKCKILFEQLLKHNDYDSTIQSLSKQALRNYLIDRLKKYGYGSYIDNLISQGDLWKMDYEISLWEVIMQRSPFYAYIIYPLRFMIEELKTQKDPILLCSATHTPTYISTKIYEDRLSLIKKRNIDIRVELQEVITSKCYPKIEDIDISLEWDIVQETYCKPYQDTTIDISVLKLHYDEEFYRYNYIRGYISYKEVKNILLWMPNHLEVLLLSLIQHIMRCSTYKHQLLYETKHRIYTSKTGNIEAIQAVIDAISMINIDIDSEVINLFIALSMLYENQTIRNSIGEYYYHNSMINNINHYLLGKTLGKLEHNEYAPLKRFTDLVVSDMLNLSSLHNQVLHTLLSAMIAHMSDEPIKGVKKLLEIYLEVLSLTNLEIPQETRTKLDVWGEVKSLRSIVKKIEDRR